MFNRNFSRGQVLQEGDLQRNVVPIEMQKASYWLS